MKNKFQSFEDGMRMAGGSIQHPLSIHSASIGTCRRHRVWQVLMTLVFLFTLSIGQMWGATESACDVLPGTSDVIINGTSYSIAATYIAGNGSKNGQMTCAGIKFRNNRTATITGVTETTNLIPFVIKEGYKITGIQLVGHSNDNTNTCAIGKIYVDGVAYAGFSETVLPNKKASTSANISITGIEATRDIVLYFSDVTKNQANIEYTITYVETGGSCSAPTDPAISGTTAYTEGDNISLTASATGATSATFTWYKGADWATASAGSSVGTGATLAINSCATSDAGTYWCNISNGTGCEVQVSKAITVAAAAGVCPSGISISGTNAYTEGQTISLTANLEAGNGEISYQWYKGSIAAGNEVGTGATFTKANCVTGDAGDYFCVASKDACSNATSSAYAITVAEKVCPTSGVVYTMTMKSKSLSGVTQNTEVALVAGDYATEEGGVSYLGNNNSDATKAQIKTEAGGIVYFNGNDAYLKVALDCPLQPGDLITIEGNASSTTNVYIITNTNSRTSEVTSTNTSGTKKYYTVVADDALDGKSTIYFWRAASSANKNIHSVTITRPYNITFESDYGVAPSATTGFEVTLAEITGVSGWEHTGWTANKDVKIGDDTKTAGTALAVDATVKVSADTKFTATWVPFSVKHTVTYYNGEAIPANKLGEEEISEGSHPTGAGLAPTKRGFTFGGWSLTNGGAAAALNTITVDADKDLFAVWTPVPCPANGTVFAFEMNNDAKPGTEVKAPANGTLVIDEYLTESGFGSAIIGNTASNQYASVKTTPNITLSGQTGYLKLALECALQAGDVITIAKNNTQIHISDEAGASGPTGNKYTTASNAENEIVVGANATTAAWAGAMDLYFWYKGGGVNITAVSVVRPYTVSFDLNGQSAPAIEDQKIIAGGKVTKPDDPVVVGQAFGGWFTDNACTAGNEWEFATATVSSDLVLYAKWTALPKMTLNAGAGTGDDVVSYPTVGSVVAVPACPAGFEYTGYIFAGWVYSPAVTVEDGSFTMPNQDLTLTAQWVDASSVARIGSNYYSTFAAAIAAAGADQTIQLLQDCSYDLTWEIGANVTLDLNGKNLTYTYAGSEKTLKQAIKVNAGTLTLMDGTATSPVISDMTADPLDETAVTYTGGFFDMGANWGVRVYDGAAVVVESGKYKAQEAVLNVYYTGSATVNGGLLYTVDNGVVMGNGTVGWGGYTINIHGGILVGHITTGGYASMVVYHPNFGTLNIDNGTLISTNGPCVVVRGGESNITGGTMIAKEQTPGFTGKCGDASQNLGAVGVAVDFKSNYPGVANTDVAISGSANVSGEASAVQAIYAGATPTTEEVAAIAISGGTFNTPVENEYCAPGYVPETKANGKYGVIVPAQSIDFMAIIAAKGTGDAGKAELDGQLSSKHYDIDGTLNDDRLEAGGFKVKKTGLTISFSVEKEKVVEITTGHISGASIKVDDAAAVAMEGDKKHTYYSDDAQAFLITMTATGNAYNIFKSINIRDPFTVTFEAHGDADPAALQGKPSVILPSATNGTKSLTGWFTEETGGTKIGDATDEYTPTANITLHAQWEDISTDARLASITLDPSTGVLSPAFDPEVTAYTYTMPYGTAAIPQITGATAVNAGGSYDIVSQAAAWGETAVIRGVAASSDTKQYNITMLQAPKDGICLIKATHTGATTATVEGKIGGIYDKLTQGGGKLGSNDHYFGVKLAQGTFQAGDIVKIYASTTSPSVEIFSGKSFSSKEDSLAYLNKGTFNGSGIYTYILEDATEWIYLYRTKTAGSAVNPTLGYIAVYRPTAPILQKVTVAGVEGAPVGNVVEIEVPASTPDAALDAITYDWISNDDAWTAAHTPAAANAWEWGVANTVTLTDKDNDQTVYTVTISKAAPSSDATLSALSYGTPATAIALADGVFEYNVLLPYGTTDVPELAATPNHAGASIASISDADAFVNRHATSTVTVKAEDNATTQVYTVNFTVDRYESKVLWDGASMTKWSDITAAAAVAGVSIVKVGDDISVVGKNASFEEKSYTNCIQYGGATSNSRNFGITIPEGKVAKVSIIYRPRSDGERSIMIGTAIAGAIDESAIVYATTTHDHLDRLTADIYAAGTIYINTTNGYQIFEVSIQLADGHGRSAMLGAGVYGTVCVDHNVAIEDIQGVTVYELMGRDYSNYGKLAFDEIISGELEAGKPYVFQAHRNHLALLYGETSVAEPVDAGNGMYGTFTDITLYELTDIYYFAQRALWSCSDLTSLSVPANRAYVKLSEVGEVQSAVPAPGRRRITMAVNGKQVVTGIDNLNAGDQPVKVMIDGQMYILRGEKMYDATGRLVK